MGKTASLANIGSIADSSLGFRNRIINGGFAVSQYNGSSSFTATTGGLRYGIDRFFMYCTGANLTGQQVAGTNTGTYKAWKITGATGSTLLNFAQRIESLNTTDLASQAVTVSVKVYCSTAISGASIYALVPTAQDNYASTTSSFSTGITLSAGLNTISVTGTIGSAGANGIEVGIAFSSGIGNGVTAEIGNFQLEKGSTATSFDYRPYTTELQLCQRYYIKINNPAANAGYGPLIGAFTSIRSLGVPYCLPVPMRVNGGSFVIAFSNVSLYRIDLSVSYPVTSIGAWAGDFSVPSIDIGVASGLTAGTSYIFTILTNGFVSYSAEL